MCNHQDEQGKVGLYRNNPKGWLPVNLPTYCSSQIINFLPNNGTGSAPYVNCTALVSVDHISRWMSNTDMTDKPNLKRVCLQEGQDNVRGYTYYPTNGTLDLSYFPYYGKLAQVQHLRRVFCFFRDTCKRHVSVNLCCILSQPTYMNPLVAVKLDLVNQRHAVIQCRVMANNIAHQNYYDPYEGKVIFHLTALS